MRFFIRVPPWKEDLLIVWAVIGIVYYVWQRFSRKNKYRSSFFEGVQQQKKSQKNHPRNFENVTLVARWREHCRGFSMFRETWLIHACDMTHSYACHDSSMMVKDCRCVYVCVCVCVDVCCASHGPTSCERVCMCIFTTGCARWV